MTQDVKNINEFIKRAYGSSGDYPRFRVVFSDEQFEKRKFMEDFYFEGKRLSSGERIEEVPKYPFIKGRYVFEIHCPTENDEIIDKVGNYEPLYTFENDGKPLPVVQDMVELLCKGFSTRAERKTPGQLQSEEDAQMEKAVQLEYEFLNEQSPHLATMLATGGAVFMDSRKKFNG